MDLDFPARSSGEGSDAFFMDEEKMRLVMACLSPSPPRMLISWSPPPPSPPASVGFGGLWDFDDESGSPLQTALIPAQVGHADAAESEQVTVLGSVYGDNTDSPGKLERVSRWGHLHAFIHDGSTDGTCLLKERLTLALRYLTESTDSCFLAQVWASVKRGGRYGLTNAGQPFVLNNQKTGLHPQFRNASFMPIFSTDSSNAGEFRLPAEWTPNVLYYINKEYAMWEEELWTGRSTYALPVFYPRTKSCVAVVQLIMRTEKVNFESEVDLMCKGLESVNLTSTYMPSRPSAQMPNHSHLSALVDILGVLTTICKTHKLPLAQTWVPCCNTGNGGSAKNTHLNLDGSCIHGVCFSTCDVAFYVADAHIWGFRDACVKHHLQKGHRIAGDAFLSNRPCFWKEVREFSLLEYPLVQHARWFELSACIAVCLQSSYTGDDVYILEIFLPRDCREDGEQKALLESIYTLMKQNMRSLKVSTHRDSGYPPLSDMPVTGNGELKEIDAQNSESRHCESALVFDRSKRKRSNTENAAASISVVQHHPCTRPINAQRAKPKSRSKVWNHFMKMDGARAICIHCKNDYAADPKIHGTSRLLRHLKHDHEIDLKASSSESGK